MMTGERPMSNPRSRDKTPALRNALLSDRLSEARTKFVGGLNSTSLLSDRLSEARTKFVGGLNSTSLLSDRLSEARTKFVGGLNSTSLRQNRMMSNPAVKTNGRISRSLQIATPA